MTSRMQRRIRATADMYALLRRAVWLALLALVFAVAASCDGPGLEPPGDDNGVGAPTAGTGAAAAGASGSAGMMTTGGSGTSGMPMTGGAGGTGAQDAGAPDRDEDGGVEDEDGGTEP